MNSNKCASIVPEHEKDLENHIRSTEEIDTESEKRTTSHSLLPGFELINEYPNMRINFFKKNNDDNNDNNSDSEHNGCCEKLCLLVMIGIIITIITLSVE